MGPSKEAYADARAARHYTALPPPGINFTKEGRREWYRVVATPGRRRRIAKLPDFPRIPDGAASMDWGKEQSAEFVKWMIHCRRQTQVPACYIAEKMGVAPEILYRLEREAVPRGIKLATALRYLHALGLEVEIVEREEVLK